MKFFFTMITYNRILPNNWTFFSGRNLQYQVFQTEIKALSNLQKNSSVSQNENFSSLRYLKGGTKTLKSQKSCQIEILYNEIVLHDL